MNIETLVALADLVAAVAVVVSLLYLAAMRQREYEYFQMKDGNIEKPIWQAYRTLITIHLGSTRTRKWWETWGKIPFDPGFCAMVDDVLDSQPNANYFDGLQRIIEAGDPGPERMQR